uniref:M56 family metallopeptidase n=3 Tax=unclassified Prevotella TaxID=2638335 RepID=A0AB33JJF8_9BACT
MAVYLLKINMSLMVFYAFYRVMMSYDTFFNYRRIALLGMLFTSLIVPLANLQPFFQQSNTIVNMAQTYAVNVLPTVTITPSISVWSWQNVVIGGYMVGVVILLLRMGWQVATIFRLASRTEVIELDGLKIHVIKPGQSPFSFMRWIFANPASQTPEQFHEILVHEHTHARQLHSLDVIVAELFCTFCWFNPFCWLIRQEVRLNLEYLADEAVLYQGCARKSYQYHLLGLAYSSSSGGLANHFKVLPLKNRIKMMNKQRTNQVGKVKYLLFLPLVAMLLAVSNVEMLAHTINEKLPNNTVLEEMKKVLPVVLKTSEQVPMMKDMQQNTLQRVVVKKGGKVVVKQDVDDKVLEVVEEMPRYPGGTKELMRYLSTNIKYPSNATINKIQGRVVVQFVVEKDGKLSNVRVRRSVHKLLDAEAVRVVRTMPRWTPGKLKGKTVRVWYNLPIEFRLNDEKKSANIQIKNIHPDKSVRMLIVDGKEVPMDALNGIDAQKIGNVTVMTDQKAVSLYGEKARGGVIIVNTKK